MRLGHVPFFLRLTGDPEVRVHLGGVAPLSRRLSQARSYIRAGAGALWEVTDRAARVPQGLIVLGPHAEEDATELSYQFLRRSWGQGFATEACRAVLAVQSTSRIVAETQAANAASRRLLVRLGFVEQRHLARYGARQVIYHKQGRVR